MTFTQTCVIIIAMKNIKQFRIKNKLTQYKLADLVGVHWRTVQNWEAGLSKPSKLASNQLKRVMGEVKHSEL